MSVIAIIPARGGSKRVVNKNIRELCGKPLIAYTIEEAKKSKYLDRIVVSSDSDNILKVAEKYGAEILKRPNHLAKDETPTMPVIEHVVESLYCKDYIKVILQPTSPLRTCDDIDSCIFMLNTGNIDSVISVTQLSNFAIKRYKLNGAVYAFKKTIWGEKTAYYLMPADRSVDIDTEDDFLLAESFMETRNDRGR